MTTKINGTNTLASPAITGDDVDTGVVYGNAQVDISIGGASKATVDSNGRLGIGTTSPSGLLHLSGDTCQLHFTDEDDSASSRIYQSGATFAIDVDQADAKDSSVLQFRVDDAEAMRITSNGFLKAKANGNSYVGVSGPYHELIANTDNQLILDMRNESGSGYGMIMDFNHQSSTNYAFQVYDFANNSSRMIIRTDGDLENANNSYGAISDVKLKENIVDAESQWDDIKALKVRNFNFKADANKTKMLGLVAQEAEAVCPSLVKSQPDLDHERNDLGTETKVLKYSILYMKAIKALQEAMAKIEVLETKVAALEAA